MGWTLEVVIKMTEFVTAELVIKLMELVNKFMVGKSIGIFCIK